MATTVGQLEIQLIADVARLQRDMEKMNSTVKRNTSRMNSSIASTVGQFKNLIGVVGVAGLGRAMVGAIDKYTKFNAQLKLATTTQKQYNQAVNDTQAIAKRAQADISAISVLYARLSNNLRDAGVEQKAIAQVTETVALGLKAQGVSTDEASSAMLQLSQAFGKGKLDGDEFRTMVEATPNLMRALADSMGVPFGALKDLAKQGLLTSETLIKAFTDPELLKTYREQAKQVETIGGAWQNLSNRFVTVIGKINEATGASKALMFVLRQAEVLLSAFEGGEKGSIMRNFLDKGNNIRQAQLASMDISELKKQALVYADAQIALNERLKGAANTKLGGALDGGSYAPNFNANIVAQDVDKIHAAQEEEARLAKQRLDEARRLSAEKQKLAEDEAQRIKDQNDYFFKEQMAQFREKQENEKKAAEESAKRVQEAFEEHQRLSKERERIAEREAEAIAREFERQSDVISRSLADSIFRGFEKGKSLAENFLDSLKNMFRTTILQPVVKLLVDSSGLSKLMMAVTGAFSGSASAGQFGGSSGGIMGALGGIKDVISSLNGSLVESIQGLSGDLISNGFDKLGGFLFQNSAIISKALPFAGAALQLLSGDVKGSLFTAAGTALGSYFGPVGGAIGGVIGKFVGGLFGGKDYDRFGTSVSGIQRVGEDYKKLNEGVIYDKPIAGSSGGLNNLNKAFSKIVYDLLDAFDIEQTLFTYSALYQRGKSGMSGGTFAANIGGNSVNRLDVALKDASLNDVYNALVNKMFGEGLVKVIQKSSLPDGIKKFFDGLVKQEDVTETINAVVSIKNALGDLPEVFRAIQFELDTTLFKSNGAQLTSRFQALSTYTNLFYTDGEKMETAFKQLSTQFGLLNQTVPSSRDEFRALVDNFNVFDEASANTFYGLVALAPALDAYYNALNDQKNILNELADALDPRRFSTYADFVSAQATIGAGGDASGFMARINNPVAMNQVMAEEIKMLRAENAETKIILEKIAFNTKKTKDIQKEWNGDGLPTERTY